jgi:hypothetical protein
VNYGSAVIDGLADCVAVTNIPVNKLKIRVRPDAEKRFPAIGEAVKNPHLMTCCEQKRSQSGSNVACPAGN